MKGYVTLTAPPAKRRWKGVAVAVVLALVVFSMLVTLAFLLGLHNRLPYGSLLWSLPGSGIALICPGSWDLGRRDLHFLFVFSCVYGFLVEISDFGLGFCVGYGSGDRAPSVRNCLDLLWLWVSILCLFKKKKKNAYLCRSRDFGVLIIWMLLGVKSSRFLRFGLRVFSSSLISMFSFCFFLENWFLN